MRREHILSIADALDYLTDCTLATVSDLAMKKSRSQYEFKRQIDIAQTGVDQMRRFNLPPTGRAADVKAEFGGSVEKWAEQFDVKKEPK